MQAESDSILIVAVLGTLIFSGFSFFVVSFLFFFTKKQAQHRTEKAGLEALFEQEILTSQIEVQNLTLQQVGQELHDNIGQLLSVARINLNIVEESAVGDQSMTFIQQANELIGQSIQDLRALTKSLDGDFVKDFGLQDSLAQELQRLRNTGRFNTELLVYGTPFPLGFQREIVLYRVVQEALQNTIKHAAATQLKIQINYSPAMYNLTILDNGRGFDYQTINKMPLNQSGAGLRNMQRRISLIGGMCQFDSAEGYGTSIVITITNPDV